MIDRKAARSALAGLGASAALMLVSACWDSDVQSESLDEIVRPVVMQWMEEWQIPGLIVYVSTPDRGTWQAALGVADVSTGAPMDFADHVRIGSITKTLTATVILQLAQEGELDLDDPLAKYLPGVDTNQATIRHALQLTSGIPNYTTAAFLNALTDDPDRAWSPSEIVDTISGLAPSFPAGTCFEYSNTNYVMLGMIAEQVGKKPLARLFQERIFEPLNMTGCSAPAATDATIPGPRSRGYMLGTKWDRSPTPPAPLPPLTGVTDINPSWAFGTGQAICTAADLAVWARALATGELLKPKIQAERLDWFPVLPEANTCPTKGSAGPAETPLIQYGLGISDLLGLFGHNGEISGYQTQTAYREADGTIIVVLSNLMITPDLTEPATALSEYISRAIPIEQAAPAGR